MRLRANLGLFHQSSAIPYDIAAPTSRKFIRSSARWNMERSTQAHIIPLHATTKRSRVRKLRGSSLRVVSQCSLMRFPPVQVADQIRSLGYDLGQA